MLRAAGDGRTAAILEFLSAGVEFVGASAEKTGKTALILAARGGHLEVCQHGGYPKLTLWTRT